MAGWKAGHQTVICLPSNNVKISTSIIVDTLTAGFFKDTKSQPAALLALTDPATDLVEYDAPDAVSLLA